MPHTLPRPGTTKEEVIAWVESLTRITGWSSTRLAREAGLAPSTLNRVLAGAGHNLSMSSIARLEAAADRRVRERVESGEIGQDEVAPGELGEIKRMIRVQEYDPRRPEPSDDWGFPEHWFRFTFNADPACCQVVAVEDDSMYPDMRPGDRVIVDTQIKAPRPAGVFMLDDGLSWTPRRLEVVPGTDPTTVLVKPKNPDYLSREVPLDQLSIVGRIIGMWRRV